MTRWQKVKSDRRNTRRRERYHEQRAGKRPKRPTYTSVSPNIRRQIRAAKDRVAPRLPPVGSRVKMTPEGPGKMCTRCGVFKVFEGNYPPCKSSGTGYHSICKKCRNKYVDFKLQYQKALKRMGPEQHRTNTLLYYHTKGYKRRRELAAKRMRVEHKSLQSPRCRYCQIHLKALYYALFLREAARTYMEARLEEDTIGLFCSRHDVYLEQQQRYAEHVAGHWAKVGQRQLKKLAA